MTDIEKRFAGNGDNGSLDKGRNPVVRPVKFDLDMHESEQPASPKNRFRARLGQ
jgi:hypothetical protein